MTPTIPPVQFRGKGPVGKAVIPAFVFPSNPPEYPITPSPRNLGKGIIYVSTNAAIPI